MPKAECMSHSLNTAGATTLDTHITGVRAHGKCTMMVIDCGQFSRDSNMTIEILLRMLFHLKVPLQYCGNAVATKECLFVKICTG